MDRQLVWQVAAILNRGDTDDEADDGWGDDDYNPAGRPFVQPSEEEMRARIERYHELRDARAARKANAAQEEPDPIV